MVNKAEKMRKIIWNLSSRFPNRNRTESSGLPDGLKPDLWRCRTPSVWRPFPFPWCLNTESDHSDKSFPETERSTAPPPAGRRKGVVRMMAHGAAHDCWCSWTYHQAGGGLGAGHPAGFGEFSCHHGLERLQLLQQRPAGVKQKWKKSQFWFSSVILWKRS